VVECGHQVRSCCFLCSGATDRLAIHRDDSTSVHPRGRGVKPAASSEIVDRGQRVRVVIALDPPSVGEVLLQQRDGRPRSPTDW
jgi:hypothetical protein